MPWLKHCKEPGGGASAHVLDCVEDEVGVSR